MKRRKELKFSDHFELSENGDESPLGGESGRWSQEKVVVNFECGASAIEIAGTGKFKSLRVVWRGGF